MLVTLKAIPHIVMEILIRSCRKCYTVKTDNCSVQALDNVGRLFHLAGKKVTHDCNQNPNIFRLEMTRHLTGRRTTGINNWLWIQTSSGIFICPTLILGKKNKAPGWKVGHVSAHINSRITSEEVNNQSDWLQTSSVMEKVHLHEHLYFWLWPYQTIELHRPALFWTITYVYDPNEGRGALLRTLYSCLVCCYSEVTQKIKNGVF